ncbi:hypothetical protein P405_17445 [Streptomyces sp. FR-008]|nr:hypothetical protein SFR_7020 [Streptomyces sp. FR-008]KAF0794896.1 hypothetical protein P405_17445 [Streptomyces sp. FR-008]
MVSADDPWVSVGVPGMIVLFFTLAVFYYFY